MESSIRHDIEIIMKTEAGKKVVHIQRRLRGLYLSPAEIVFRAEDLLSSGKFNIRYLEEALWRRFPLYNIDDEKMDELIQQLRYSFEKKNRIIIPKELLSLAVLNVVDGLLQKKNMSCFFKSKYLSNLSMGRRSYASRFLCKNKYITECGKVWKRTNKEFNQKDFWIEHIK